MKSMEELIYDINNQMSFAEVCQKYGFEKHVPYTYTEETEKNCPYEEYIAPTLSKTVDGVTFRLSDVIIQVIQGYCTLNNGDKDIIQFAVKGGNVYEY